MKAREMALKTLVRVSEQGSYSNLALKAMLENSTDKRENALASLLVYGVLQQMMRLDYIISKYSSVKMKKLSPAIHNILRLGVYQLIFTDKIPASAAINESVVLAKKYGHKASSGFVNAVLRSVQRGGNAVEYPPKDTADYLSVYYSYPKWYCEYLPAIIGFWQAEKVLMTGNTPPDFSLRVNTLKTDTKTVLNLLKEQGVDGEQGNLLTEQIILKNGTDIARLNAYNNGLVQPQDGASMLVSRVVNPKSGQRVIDCCAAPGGKTTHMAQLMDNKGEIIAFDIHPSRVSLIEQASKRMGCNIIGATVQDAAICRDELIGSADRVLADVPCSGMGIVRRKPEIKYSIEQSGIAELAKLQYSILLTASKYLKAGGELVYSTCTVINEENIDVVQRFLNENPQFEWCDITELLPQELRASCKGGYIQLYCGDHGCDGFFISKIRRKV